MEDDVMAILGQSKPEDFEKVESKARSINQALTNVGAEPDYTADVAEMQKQGYTFDGYHWVKQ